MAFRYAYANNKNNQSPIFHPYNESELLALQLGYQEVSDTRAFRGRYFIKNGKKWIHNLGALRHKLAQEYGHYITDEELSASEPEGFGYDIEAYYGYQISTFNNEPKKDLHHWVEFKQLMEQVLLN